MIDDARRLEKRRTVTAAGQRRREQVDRVSGERELGRERAPHAIAAVWAAGLVAVVVRQERRDHADESQEKEEKSGTGPRGHRLARLPPAMR